MKRECNIASQAATGCGKRTDTEDKGVFIALRLLLVVLQTLADSEVFPCNRVHRTADIWSQNVRPRKLSGQQLPNDMPVCSKLKKPYKRPDDRIITPRSPFLSNGVYFSNSTSPTACSCQKNGSSRPDQPRQANHIFSPQTRNRKSRDANSKLQPLAAVIQLLSAQVVLFHLQGETRSTRTRLQETGQLCQRFAVRRLGVARPANHAR